MTILQLEIADEFEALDGTLRTHWDEIERYHWDLMQDEDAVIEAVDQGAKLCCPMCGSNLETLNTKH